MSSNKSFVDWGDIFSDAVLAAAILDRPLHHWTTINIKRGGLLAQEQAQDGRTNAPQ